jgi:hypothetical protein
MAMTESERSLRTYLMLAGALAISYALWTLLHRHALAHQPVVAIGYSVITQLASGAALVIAGIDLPRALRTRTRWIPRTLIAAAAAILAQVAVTYLSSGPRTDPNGARAALGASLFAITLPLAIVSLLYVLYANVQRLTAPAAASASS